MSALGMRCPGLSGSRVGSFRTQLAAALMIGSVTLLSITHPTAVEAKIRKPHKVLSKAHSRHAKRTAHSKRHPKPKVRTAQKKHIGKKALRTAQRHGPSKHTRIARLRSHIRVARHYHDPDKLIMPEGDGSPVLELAAHFLGRPYRFGADLGAFDCSGFVRRVFSKVGIDLPHSAREQFTYGDRVGRDDLEPGDLVFFGNSRRRYATHVGIYVGEDKFVHAARRSGQVQVDSLSEAYFAEHYLGARRLEI
jgi:cell wall-associated NlpC family hydrolase